MEMIELTEDLKRKLEKAESLEDVANICAEEGLQVTAGELQELVAEQTGELSPDAMDKVTGGRIGVRGPTEVDAVRKIVKWIIGKFK